MIEQAHVVFTGNTNKNRGEDLQVILVFGTEYPFAMRHICNVLCNEAFRAYVGEPRTRPVIVPIQCDCSDLSPVSKQLQDLVLNKRKQSSFLKVRAVRIVNGQPREYDELPEVTKQFQQILAQKPDQLATRA